MLFTANLLASRPTEKPFPATSAARYCDEYVCLSVRYLLPVLWITSCFHTMSSVARSVHAHNSTTFHLDLRTPIASHNFTPYEWNATSACFSKDRKCRKSHFGTFDLGRRQQHGGLLSKPANLRMDFSKILPKSLSILIVSTWSSAGRSLLSGIALLSSTQPASSTDEDGSLNRIGQVAPTCSWSNTWFLGPTPNGRISIGSVVFAGLTAVTNTCSNISHLALCWRCGLKLSGTRKLEFMS